MTENNYEIKRVAKFDGKVEIIKGSVHGWATWEEFCNKMKHKHPECIVQQEVLSIAGYNFFKA